MAELCPPALPGDLVVSEIRPEQGGTFKQWIELYNASGLTLDLEGAIIDVLSIDGGTRLRLIVRRSLELADGEYVALGEAEDADADRPAYLGYGFGADFEQEGTPKDLPTSGAITVTACGEQIDRVQYEGLPDEGTFTLGTMPPTAEANDDDASWCVDTTPPEDTTEIGLPGTPGAANTPCVVPVF